MDKAKIASFIEQTWENSIIPTLIDFIKIPNKSPMFDADWQQHGFMDQAVELLCQWAREHELPGMTLDVVHLEGRTPLIFIDAPGKIDKTVILYGHLDKQPEMTGWDASLGPWKPVRKGDNLYGRGGADDGYALFSAMNAIASVQQQGIDHPRCIILIEACEESGSYDLPYYIDHLQDKLGNPALIICLDSGAGNYDQLWLTTSLRGVITGSLSVEVISEGVHSGNASGIVPSSFRIIRTLLDRIENKTTGEIILPELTVDIPQQRLEQAQHAANVLGKKVYEEFPFLDHTQPVSKDLAQLILNRTWRPALSVIGVAGMPSLEQAGNVLRPKTVLKLSLRVPPTCDVQQATQVIKRTLEYDPPYHAKVEFIADVPGPGWHSPAVAPWLAESINQASETYFGKPAVYMGEGGSIPFMGILGKKFPNAQFFITGVLGPHSNAHGPNEFLHIPVAKKITACVAHVLGTFNEMAPKKAVFI